MSAKSPRKAETLTLDAAGYGALIAYARRRGARSLAAAARLAIRAWLAGERFHPTAPPPRPRRLRPLRLQLEPALRAELRQRGASAADALQRFLLGDRG